MLKGRYELLKGYENIHVTIGFGSYGQVKLAKNLDDGEIVAVKIINKLAKNQITLHNKLQHPKIIKLLNYQIDKQRQITHMVLQYADDGTLFQKIKTSFLPKHKIKSYFRDVCSAVFYLHSKEIMHRDIKPENILLTKNGQAKLCDFGFAAILGQRKTLCGTYQYMSPQMIQNRSYDYKIDIWALGILLFQMISGQAPFRGESPEQVLNQMKTKIYFCDKFESQEINLIKTILRVTPHKRPTIQQILNHPFFHEDQKTYLYSTSELTKLKNLKSVSNSNLSSVACQSQLFYSPIGQSKNQNINFNKKWQKSQNLKKPQNSYPFYIPKTKSGSTGSTANDANEISYKTLIPENNYSNFYHCSKTYLMSPKKKDNPDLSTIQEGNFKQNVFKSPSNFHHGIDSTSSNYSFSTNSSKDLNILMGTDFKMKFNSNFHTLNNLNSNLEKKGRGLQFQQANKNKTYFVPTTNKTLSNRFS